MENERKVERCGYCGVYVLNGTSVPPEVLTHDERDNCKLGYCENAQQEHYEQFPEDMI